MAELLSLLDKLSQLVRHLITMVKDDSAPIDRLVFMGAIQAIGNGLDSINVISRATEAKDYIIGTRQFVESMIAYVAAKSGKGDAEAQLQLFLERAHTARLDLLFIQACLSYLSFADF